MSFCIGSDDVLEFAGNTKVFIEAHIGLAHTQYPTNFIFNPDYWRTNRSNYTYEWIDLYGLFFAINPGLNVPISRVLGITTGLHIGIYPNGGFAQMNLGVTVNY